MVTGHLKHRFSFYFYFLTANIQDVGLSCVFLILGAKLFSQVQRSISSIKLASSRILHFVLQRVLLIWNPTVIQKQWIEQIFFT